MRRTSLAPLLAFVLLAPTWSVPRAAAQDGAAPRFEDYAAGKAFSGRPAPVKIASASARHYRTMLRTGASSGPNFAGHFTIVTWGCGTGCTQSAIVDAATGTAFFPRELQDFAVPVGYDWGGAKEGLDFRRDSALLVASGSVDEGDTVASYYYRWANGRLELLKTVVRKPTPNP